MHHPVNTVSHVVYCFEPENLDRAVEFWQALGVELTFVDQRPLGLRIFLSFEAGVELIAPVFPDGSSYAHIRAHLDAHGEGIMNVVFGVDDLGRAEAAVLNYGATVARRLDYTDSDLWRGQCTSMREAILEPVHGMKIVLGEMQVSGPPNDVAR